MPVQLHEKESSTLEISNLVSEMLLFTFDIKEKCVSSHDPWISMATRCEIPHLTRCNLNNRIFNNG